MIAAPTKEIGWFPIELTAAAQAHPWFQDWPSQLTVLHWHGEMFSLPTDVILLAKSAACLQQGFLWGDRVVGLQFHLEVTSASFGELIRHCQHELVRGSFIQSATEIQAQAAQTALLTPHLEHLLDRWISP